MLIRIATTVPKLRATVYSTEMGLASCLLIEVPTGLFQYLRSVCFIELAPELFMNCGGLLRLMSLATLCPYSKIS